MACGSNSGTAWCSTSFHDPQPCRIRSTCRSWAEWGPRYWRKWMGWPGTDQDRRNVLLGRIELVAGSSNNGCCPRGGHGRYPFQPWAGDDHDRVDATLEHLTNVLAAADDSANDAVSRSTLDLPNMRVRSTEQMPTDACRFFSLQGLRRDAQAAAGRLLRVLLLRHGAVPAGPARRGSLRRCGPFVEERHDPRSGDIAGLQPPEPKARLSEQIIDLAIEVAAARNSMPQRIETVLPAARRPAPVRARAQRRAGARRP